MRLEAEPYGRHAEAHRDALRLEQLVEARTVEAHTGQHELCPVHRRDIGHAPGAGVEHRHDRADRIAARHRDGVGERGAVGVQHRRAMAVEDSLGLAGGAGGVAQRRCAPLVELGPDEPLFVLGRYQLVIGGDDRESGLGRFEQDKAAIRRQLWHQALDQRDEAGLDKQHPVLRMVDDVDDLFIEQARIDRVAHRADPRDAVIELEMAIIVPGEGADPVAGADAEPHQGARQPARAAFRVGVAIAVDRAVDHPRHDLDVAMKTGCMLDQRGYQERLF